MDIIGLKKIINTYLKLRKDRKKNKEVVEALELSLKNIFNTPLDVVLSDNNMHDLMLLINTYEKITSMDLKLKLLDIILNNKKEDVNLPYNPEPIIYPRPYWFDPTPYRITDIPKPNPPVICSTLHKIFRSKDNEQD